MPSADTPRKHTKNGQVEMNDLRVVLDTNILISSVSFRSPYRVLIDRLMEGKYDIYITNDILLEYEEKIRERYDQITADLFLDALSVAPNVHKIETYYQLRLIYPDLDDNKFVDCAFAANAHLLVTNDKDFRVLRQIDFPKFNLMRLEEFTEFVKAF